MPHPRAWKPFMIGVSYVFHGAVLFEYYGFFAPRSTARAAQRPS
jgi:hypothetical protein